MSRNLPRIQEQPAPDGWQPFWRRLPLTPEEIAIIIVILVALKLFGVI